jgi:hypothetical protein
MSASSQDLPEGKKLSEVLVEEFEAIKGGDECLRCGSLLIERAPDRYQPNREETPEQKEQRERRLIYDVAYQLNLNALCLSGGGIRSAAISLGVIQALADKGLLNKFHYLSTVSGGGYIGSWLSAWLHHTEDATKVLYQLGTIRRNSDQEPPPLQHLREYSNYLTPKVGLFSADTWTALSIVLRNMAVNFWLILLPTLALVVIGIKLLALFVSWEADQLIYLSWEADQFAYVSWEADQFAYHSALIGLISFCCIAAGAMAFGYKLGRLYIPPYGEPSTAAEKARAKADPEGEPERVPKWSLADAEVPSQAQRRFLLWSLLPAIIAGFCFVWLAVQDTTPALGLLQSVTGVDWANSFLAVLLFSFLVFSGAIVIARLWRNRLMVPRRLEEKLTSGGDPTQMTPAQITSEIVTLAGRRIVNGSLTDQERDRLTMLVAAQAGINKEEAAKRVAQMEQDPVLVGRGSHQEYEGLITLVATIAGISKEEAAPRVAQMEQDPVTALAQPEQQARKAGRPAHELLFDYVSWIGAVIVFAGLVWAGAKAIHLLPHHLHLYTAQICDVFTTPCPDKHSHAQPINIRHETLTVVFGLPWYLAATVCAHFTYLLLYNRSPKGEIEREWLGRASGWHFIAALAWVILSAIVLIGPAIVYNLKTTSGLLLIASGAVNWVLGKSSVTPANGPATDWKGLAANIALAVSGPLFVALLLIVLAVGIDWAIIGWNSQCFATDLAWDNGCYNRRWIFLSGITIVVLLAGNVIININAFSLHAVYRNRLVRCFLGGAREPYRHSERFTDFDWNDDLRVAALWKRDVLPMGRDWRPFHVINMTLNLAVTNRLAWQERKAMPFSVTPFACGNADLGYRETNRYGGVPKSKTIVAAFGSLWKRMFGVGLAKHEAAVKVDAEIKSGISLGTAMAISGAAVSSNMGYHSSMSLSFLLTFFNVRLGVWLGNPGARLPRWPQYFGLHRPYEKTGPQFAVRPLLSELFGLTDDDSPYVNLSDGGHFEDLGLYEMVRRRCRRIIIVDGDQDRDRGFEDLGNAVRKIWIDLGVRITFSDSGLLAAEKDAKLASIPYFAVGKIKYVSDFPVAGRVPTGEILYIKPVVRGDESAADVIAYKRAHDDFPAQSTAQQWFDESQFESYRRLGQLMAERIIEATEVNQANPKLTTLFEGLNKIEGATMKKERLPVNIC